MNSYDVADLLLVCSHYIQHKITGYELLTKYYIKVYDNNDDIINVDILFKLTNQATLALAIDNLNIKENINSVELLS